MKRQNVLNNQKKVGLYSEEFYNPFGYIPNIGDYVASQDKLAVGYALPALAYFGVREGINEIYEDYKCYRRNLDEEYYYKYN